MAQIQGGGDKCKGGFTILEGLRPLFSSSFGSTCPQSSRMYYPLFFLVKLSCDTDVSIPSIFAAVRQNQGNYTLTQYTWCCFSDLTWLKQAQLRPCEAEGKHSRSLTRQKLLQRKQKKKIQQRGSDKKPSVLETGTAKAN